MESVGMSEYLKKNRVLAVAALLGVLLSLLPIAGRVRAEQNGRYYDVIISYSSLQAMAAQSRYSEGEWLDLFRSWGVDKIALGDSDARNLSNNPRIPIFAGAVTEIRNSHGWQLRYPEAVAQWIAEAEDVFDALVIVEDPAYFSWVRDGYERRFDHPDYRVYQEDGVSYLYFPTQANGRRGSDLLNLPIGIWPGSLALAEEHGFQVIPRSQTVDKLNGAAFARSVLEVLEASGSPYFLNAGDSLPGYDSDEGKAILKNYIRDSGIAVGMFEQNDQSGNLDWEGFTALLEETGYHGVRLFNEWPYIQNRYAYCGYEGPEEITNSFFRAVAERGCRIIYMNMILEPDNDVTVDADQNEWTYITDPADYEQMLRELDVRLTRLGYVHQTVPPMSLAAPGRLLPILQGIGAAAALVLLLGLFLPLEAKHRLFAALTAFVTALGLLRPGLFRLLLSMGGGIVMPSLAAVWLCRHSAAKRRETPAPGFAQVLGDAMVSALFAAALSFGGALLASSALAQLSYLLEIDLYRGVKLMQLIPIGVFCLAYLLVFAYEESGAKAAVTERVGTEPGRVRRFLAYWRELMDRPMKLGWMAGLIAAAAAGALVLLVGVYYIYRTGNTTNVSARELALRNILENLLIARPRTKEFLIGWPCTMLFVWALRRQMNILPLLAGLGMSIGLVSVVNTFLHIRTPFLLSLLRTGWGLLFGLLLGAALTAAAELLLRLFRSLRARLREV